LRIAAKEAIFLLSFSDWIFLGEQALRKSFHVYSSFVTKSDPQ
jgi:hypothetical protein